MEEKIDIFEKKLDADCNLMMAWIEKAKKLQIGKKYVLYQYATQDRTSAVKIERILVAKNPHNATFKNKHGRVISYTYAELAQMIQKPPEGCRIKTEREKFIEEEFGKDKKGVQTYQ